jgi:hypothetical protein
MNEERRRQPDPRRRQDMRDEQRLKLLKLVDRLRMQARTRCAANRMMHVEPRDPENTLEWEAAATIERLISGRCQ